MVLAWRQHAALQDSGYNVHRWHCVPADNTQPSRSKGNEPKDSLGNTSFLGLWPYFLPALGSWLLNLWPYSNSHNESEILVVTKYFALLWLQGSKWRRQVLTVTTNDISQSAKGSPPKQVDLSLPLRTHVKIQMWWCLLVILVLGRQKREDSWDHLAYSLKSRPRRDPVSDTKEDCPWGTTLKVDVWPIGAAVCWVLVLKTWRGISSDFLEETGYCYYITQQAEICLQLRGIHWASLITL